MTNYKQEDLDITAYAIPAPTDCTLNSDDIYNLIEVEVVSDAETQINYIHSADVARALRPNFEQLWNAYPRDRAFPEIFDDLGEDQTLICTFSQTEPGKMTSAILMNRDGFRVSKKTLDSAQPENHNLWYVGCEVIAAVFDKPENPSDTDGTTFSNRLAGAAAANLLYEYGLSFADDPSLMSADGKNPTPVGKMSCSENGLVEDSIRALLVVE